MSDHMRQRPSAKQSLRQKRALSPGILISLLLVLLLTACTDLSPGSSPGNQNTETTLINHHGMTPAIIQRGKIREYPLARGVRGEMLMRPAIDRQGAIWFGVMGSDYIARFDPGSSTFQRIVPPHGRGGMMGLLAASDGSIWFAEQYANYIGHYLPQSGQFRIYSLPRVTLPTATAAGGRETLPVAPNDLAIDRQGMVWFTEMNADALGRLNPSSGDLQQFPLAAHQSVQQLNPYGIAIDQQNNVWFSESSQNRIGRLNPYTGQITTFALPDLQAEPMEIAIAPQGQIWITTFARNLLLCFDPRTQRFSSYYAPTSSGATNGLYGLATTASGAIWVTVAAANAIARLDTTAGRFLYYPLPTPASFPFGIAAQGERTLWFTEAGSNALGMLRPA